MGDQIEARCTDFMTNESDYPTLEGEIYKLVKIKRMIREIEWYQPSLSWQDPRTKIEVHDLIDLPVRGMIHGNKGHGTPSSNELGRFVYSLPARSGKITHQMRRLKKPPLRSTSGGVKNLQHSQKHIYPESSTKSQQEHSNGYLRPLGNFFVKEEADVNHESEGTMGTICKTVCCGERKRKRSLLWGFGTNGHT
ncbi:hypothetical protein YC2023_117873 [Brassica napus]